MWAYNMENLVLVLKGIKVICSKQRFLPSVRSLSSPVIFLAGLPWSGTRVNSSPDVPSRQSTKLFQSGAPSQNTRAGRFLWPLSARGTRGVYKVDVFRVNSPWSCVCVRGASGHAGISRGKVRERGRMWCQRGRRGRSWRLTAQASVKIVRLLQSPM